MRLRINGERGQVEVTPTIVVAGIDWGFGDPIAFEVGAKFGNLWVNVFEVYETKMSIPEVLKTAVQLTRRFGLERIWADPEDPKMIEYLASHGLPVLPNQIKEVDYGLRTLYGLMKQESFHPALGRGPRWRLIPDNCPGIMAELHKYSYAVVKGEVRSGKPVDKHNHGIDATRYYLTGEGEVPPESNVPTPLERPTIYRGADGRMRDDVSATLAQRKMPQEDVDAPWWDETVEADFGPEIIGIDDQW